MKQTEAILRHLQNHDGLTPIEALDLYGCFRLAARVSDLKAAGYRIETEIVHAPNGKRYARYHLVRVDEQLAVGF